MGKEATVKDRSVFPSHQQHPVSLWADALCSFRWGMVLPEASCMEHSPLSHALFSKDVSLCYKRGYSNEALQTSFLQPGSHFDHIKAV